MNQYQIKYKEGGKPLRTIIEAKSIGEAEGIFINSFGSLVILEIKDLNA